MEKNFTVGLLVSNHFGVLTRVSSLFAKRCYNIHSLAVGTTSNPEYSRMTIVVQGNDYVKEQLVKQLDKLYDVHTIAIYDDNNSVSVEHMLIKIQVESSTKNNLTSLINSFSGKVMDFSNTSVTAEITGDSSKIDEFITESKKFGIIEVCRSGLIAMSHGNENTLTIK